MADADVAAAASANASAKSPAHVPAATPSPTAAPRFGSIWIFPPLLILLGLFFYPLSLIVRQGLMGDDHLLSFARVAKVLSSREFGNSLYHTVTIALTSSAGCLILGFVLSLIIAFVPFPGARLLGRLIDTFIALPTFLVALAFTFIYGSSGLLNQSLMHLLHLDLPPINFLYSKWGVILSEITVYTPFIMRPLLASFSLIDPAQIDVASSLGARPMRIVRKILLPAALPALVAGGSLCLLLTVNEFGIVLFIGAKGITTLPLLVYNKAIQESDYTTACIIATFNILLSFVLYGLYRMVINYWGGRRAGLV